ncbi:MAG TPA: PilT/PilU family type 4a pilus ATPase [Elusimicrobiota bacterium]|nr:PilT/PilU family type 4a pilus ATPase [Elusimicrobiota bacterium]
MTDNNVTLADLLRDVAAKGGSDLHLVPGLPPLARVGGNLRQMSQPELDAAAVGKLIEPYMDELRRQTYEREMRANFSFSIEGIGRFRFSVCQTLGMPSAAIRLTPTKIHPLSMLGLPPIVQTLVNRRAGLIFITGATGNGKSTTMAAMLEHINQNGEPSKIMTVEDPIEFLFKPAHSVFVQREVGVDTPSFDMGIVDALRQDPDILCVGEMRGTASINAALLAAETGHLVLTTLHTRDASKTAQRIVAAFSQVDQDGIREQLASTLEAVISQRLLPRADGRGLVLACEVMVATSAVRQLIRENKFEAINDAIQSGLKDGMVSLDASIKGLYQKQLISRATAVANMRNPEMLPAAPTQVFVGGKPGGGAAG